MMTMKVVGKTKRLRNRLQDARALRQENRFLIPHSPSLPLAGTTITKESSQGKRGRERHGGCEKVGEEIAAVVLTSPSLSLPNNKQTGEGQGREGEVGMKPL